MKLRLIPILISIIISTVVLFGGWFSYRSYAMETPLTKKVEQIAGVRQAHFEFTNKNVIVTLKLKSEANIRTVYDDTVKLSDSSIGSRSRRRKAPCSS